MTAPDTRGTAVTPGTTASGAATKIDLAAAAELEKKYDSEVRFRPLTGFTAGMVSVALVALSVFHYYTAGFGILTEHWHKSLHLAGVLGLIFIMFPTKADGLMRIGGVPLHDWVLAILVMSSSLYLPLVFDELTFRIGSPNTPDMVMGTIMIVLVLECARRAMGWVLPVIVMVFIAYGLFGNNLSGVLAHPGSSWESFLSHVYLTQEGIFGIPVKVVATFVFHFVLFGVLATRMGLGQFFIDLASIIAGRYAGGPAKVAVVVLGDVRHRSAGSSIANTVTTGSLTIPAMKRVGYKPHFAGAVEAAASTGGQITPPIMGAAAFVMIEFLEISLTTLLIAASIPAAMHFCGVFVQVHFEAKRLGLRGMEPSEIPRLWPTVRDGWPTLIPLVLLVAVILDGYTPYLAAFTGITACIVVGFLNPRNRLTLRDLWDALDMGARYALAVGAAAAAVGMVVGVVTLTGAGFRIGFIVTQAAVRRRSSSARSSSCCRRASARCRASRCSSRWCSSR